MSKKKKKKKKKIKTTPQCTVLLSHTLTPGNRRASIRRGT
jgi:hypothetical protein